MASCQIWWKNSWKTMRIRGDIIVEKPANNSKNEYFDCSVWWKIVRFCEFLFGFSEYVRVICGKTLTDRNAIKNHKIHNFHIAYNYYY